MSDDDGLKVMEAAREFRDRVLRLVEKMPRRASSDLKEQLSDAVRSVVSNIAEGLGRGSPADQARFLWMANGSLEEAQEDLRECINSMLISKKEFYREWNRSVVISKMLKPLIAQRKS